MNRMSVNLSPDQMENVAKIATARGISKNDVIRQAIGMENFFYNELMAGNKILVEDHSGKLKQVVRT